MLMEIEPVMELYCGERKVMYDFKRGLVTFENDRIMLKEKMTLLPVDDENGLLGVNETRIQYIKLTQEEQNYLKLRCRFIGYSHKAAYADVSGVLALVKNGTVCIGESNIVTNEPHGNSFIQLHLDNGKLDIVFNGNDKQTIYNVHMFAIVDSKVYILHKSTCSIYNMETGLLLKTINHTVLPIQNYFVDFFSFRVYLPFNIDKLNLLLPTAKNLLLTCYLCLMQKTNFDTSRSYKQFLPLQLFKNNIIPHLICQ